MTTLEAYKHYRETKSIPSFELPYKTLNTLYKKYIPFKWRFYIAIYGAKPYLMYLLKDVSSVSGETHVTEFLSSLEKSLYKYPETSKKGFRNLTHNISETLKTYYRMVHIYLPDYTIYALMELNDERYNNNKIW